MRHFSMIILLSLLSLSNPLSAQPAAVLTSIKPLQQIAAAVMDGIDTPAVLLPPGASPHTYALRPSDRRALQQAQRIYWVGPEMELFLEGLLGSDPKARALIRAPGVHQRKQTQSQDAQDEAHPSEADHTAHSDHGQSEDHHDHDDHASHADEHAHGHSHAPGSLDGHIWLAPDNALAIAQFMAADLVAIYPQQQAQLTANLARFTQHIQALDQAIANQLAPLRGKPYFVFHDGYGYFQDYYQLPARGAFSLSHEVQPGAKHVNRLRQQLTAAGASCVFSEPQFTPRMILSLSQGLPVTMGELDPLGIDIAVSASGYAEFMQDLTDRLSGCRSTLP